MITDFFLGLARGTIDFMFGWIPSAGDTPDLIRAGFGALLLAFYRFDFIISFYDSLANARAVLAILTIEYTIYLFAALYKRIPVIGK